MKRAYRVIVLSFGLMVLGATALLGSSASAATSNALRQRLTDARGTDTWPETVTKKGGVSFIIYNCACRQGGFAFVDATGRIVLDTGGFAVVVPVVERELISSKGHLQQTGESYQGAQSLPNGGNQYIFANTIAECEACKPFAAIKFAAEFDKAGKFITWKGIGYATVQSVSHGKSPPGN